MTRTTETGSPSRSQGAARKPKGVRMELKNASIFCARRMFLVLTLARVEFATVGADAPCRPDNQRVPVFTATSERLDDDDMEMPAQMALWRTCAADITLQYMYVRAPWRPGRAVRGGGKDPSLVYRYVAP